MFDWFQNLTKSEAEKRQEKLNAFLDGALTPAAQSRFEAQLAQDEVLRTELEQLRGVKQALSQLPHIPAPRNFTLDPAAYGKPAAQPVMTLYPIFRAATALTAILLVVLLSVSLLPGRGQAEAVTFNEAADVAESNTTANQAAAAEMADGEDEAVREAVGANNSSEEAANDQTRSVIVEAEAEVVEEAFDEMATDSALEGELDAAPQESSDFSAGSAAADDADDGTLSADEAAAAETSDAASDSTLAAEMTTLAESAAPTALPTLQPAPEPVPEPPLQTGNATSDSRLNTLAFLQIFLGILLVILIPATLFLRQKVKL